MQLHSYSNTTVQPIFLDATINNTTLFPGESGLLYVTEPTVANPADARKTLLGRTTASSILNLRPAASHILEGAGPGQAVLNLKKA